jgi:anthranilate synthase component 2
MILLIDNYDSFVHTLAGYVRALGHEALVRRHDALSVDDAVALAPTHVIVSPGPCGPAEAGISTPVIRRLGPTTPVLGVCLGHQCIAAAYGGRVVRAGRPMHGRTSPIRHAGTGLFAGLPSPFLATRYHSLAVEAASLPDALAVTATADDDGEIMALAHREHPVFGVQFHPESILSEHGHAMLAAFLALPPGPRRS